MKHANRAATLLASLALLTTTVARADALHEWNVKAIEAAVAARMPPALATRTTAIVQTAVYEAVNAIHRPLSRRRAELASARRRVDRRRHCRG
jgi:hypothetical protein